jgi:hypothetical protein
VPGPLPARTADAAFESLKDEEGNVRNKAAEILLAYAWGKPTQAVEMSGPEGSPVSISINRTVKK